MSITHSVHNDWLREEGLIEMKMIKAGPITEIPVSSHTRYLAARLKTADITCRYQGLRHGR
jgi:hypothetical protein